MLSTEVGIAQSIASSITATTTYILLCLVAGFLIYFFKLLDFFDIPGTYKMIIAILIPVAILEFILSIIFGMIGIPLNWGSYAYHFPYFGDIVVTSGVQLSKFLDMVFNFGLFRVLGLPYFTEFVKTVPTGEMVLISVPEGGGMFGLVGTIFSGWMPVLTFLYVSLDSIIDYIFFYILISAILAVVADNLKNQKTYAAGIAVIPVVLYSIYISNPFEEFPKALTGIQEIFYFWGHADGLALFMFFGTLVVSFIIVMEIIALASWLLLKGATTTLQPGWATKEWSISHQGISFGYTTAFMVMYFMHNYEWYIFFVFLILYSLLKKVGGVAIETSNAHTERQEIRDLISSINNNNGQQVPVKLANKKGNKIEIILVMGVLLIIVVFLINNGFVKL